MGHEIVQPPEAILFLRGRFGAAAAQRFRHGFTGFRFQPVWWAIAWLPMPSTASKMIVARCFKREHYVFRAGTPSKFVAPFH